MQDDTVLAWLLVPVHCGNSVQIFNLVNSKLYFWTPPYWISIISKPKVTFKHLSIPLISLIFSPKWGEFFFLDCKIFNRVNEQEYSPLWIPWIVNIYIKRKRKIFKGGEMSHLWSPTNCSSLWTMTWSWCWEKEDCFFYQIKFRHGLEANNAFELSMPWPSLSFLPLSLNPVPLPHSSQSLFLTVTGSHGVALAGLGLSM